MNTNKEKEILQKLRTNSSHDEAFTLLVTHYKESLYFHIRRICISHQDSEDALQETLLRAYRHLGKFKQDSNIYTWLYRIATNEALRIIEKRNRRKTEDIDKMYNLEQGNIWREDADKINILMEQAVAKLPTKQKIVFSLRYYNELSYKEIEKITDTSQSALKVSYHLAEKKIKEYISSFLL